MITPTPSKYRRTTLFTRIRLRQIFKTLTQPRDKYLQEGIATFCQYYCPPIYKRLNFNYSQTARMGSPELRFTQPTVPSMGENPYASSSSEYSTTDSFLQGVELQNITFSPTA